MARIAGIYGSGRSISADRLHIPFADPQHSRNPRGYAHKWDENFNNESSDFNTLAMQLLDDAGYRAQAPGHGKLRLEATIRKLTYNSYSNKTDFDQAECELRWNLFQARQKQPFFTMDTKGAGRVDSSKTGAIKAAFELGLRRLLESEDFAEAVKSQ